MAMLLEMSKGNARLKRNYSTCGAKWRGVCQVVCFLSGLPGEFVKSNIGVFLWIPLLERTLSIGDGMI
jgi:hypothetical protein